eukprot:TRINITY_DN5396_c0_g1_i2.p2 TRINITY_DN5396_c0_g1~~TRINITY_DN5396_c0_g1_i2.p2  ORF type:complete len:171 (+),score=35.92 TRINITY_DN5396_c0_g1_i2:645-1157(+)
MDRKWQLRALGVKSIAMCISKNWWLLDRFDISTVTNKLYDPEIQVRKAASDSLASIMLLLPREVLVSVTNEFKVRADSCGGNEIVLHGAVLGLIALVKSHVVEIGDWVVEVLSYITKYKDNYGIVSDSVRLCIAEFWNRHKPTWEHEKHKFNKEQQDALAEHINPYNYFA